MVLLEVENNAEIRKFENNVTLRELMYGKGNHNSYDCSESEIVHCGHAKWLSIIH